MNKEDTAPLSELNVVYSQSVENKDTALLGELNVECSQSVVNLEVYHTSLPHNNPRAA